MSNTEASLLYHTGLGVYLIWRRTRDLEFMLVFRLSTKYPFPIEQHFMPILPTGYLSAGYHVFLLRDDLIRGDVALNTRARIF